MQEDQDRLTDDLPTYETLIGKADELEDMAHEIRLVGHSTGRSEPYDASDMFKLAAAAIRGAAGCLERMRGNQ